MDELTPEDIADIRADLDASIKQTSTPVDALAHFVLRVAARFLDKAAEKSKAP